MKLREAGPGLHGVGRSDAPRLEDLEHVLDGGQRAGPADELVLAIRHPMEVDRPVMRKFPHFGSEHFQLVVGALRDAARLTPLLVEALVDEPLIGRGREMGQDVELTRLAVRHLNETLDGLTGHGKPPERTLRENPNILGVKSQYIFDPKI